MFYKKKKYAYITGTCSSTKRSILTKQPHLLCNTNDKTCLILKIPPLMKPCNQEWMEFSWLITVCCFKKRASLKICRLYSMPSMPMRACNLPLLSILKLPAGGGAGLNPVGHEYRKFPGIEVCHSFTCTLFHNK